MLWHIGLVYDQELAESLGICAFDTLRANNLVCMKFKHIKPHLKSPRIIHVTDTRFM